MLHYYLRPVFCFTVLREVQTLCSQYPALLVESESLLQAVNKCMDRSNASARVYIQQLNNEYNEIRCGLCVLLLVVCYLVFFCFMFSFFFLFCSHMFLFFYVSFVVLFHCSCSFHSFHIYFFTCFDILIFFIFFFFYIILFFLFLFSSSSFTKHFSFFNFLFYYSFFLLYLFLSSLSPFTSYHSTFLLCNVILCIVARNIRSCIR